MRFAFRQAEEILWFCSKNYKFRRKFLLSNRSIVLFYRNISKKPSGITELRQEIDTSCGVYGSNLLTPR